jgi:hypothetical protein
VLRDNLLLLLLLLLLVGEEVGTVAGVVVDTVVVEGESILFVEAVAVGVQD